MIRQVTSLRWIRTVTLLPYTQGKPSDECTVERNNSVPTTMGLTHKTARVLHLSMPSQCRCPAEHMVCWTSVQYPHRLCVTGILQLAWPRVPCNIYVLYIVYLTCVVHVYVLLPVLYSNSHNGHSCCYGTTIMPLRNNIHFKFGNWMFSAHEYNFSETLPLLVNQGFFPSE